MVDFVFEESSSRPMCSNTSVRWALRSFLSNCCSLDNIQLLVGFPSCHCWLQPTLFPLIKVAHYIGWAGAGNGKYVFSNLTNCSLTLLSPTWKVEQFFIESLRLQEVKKEPFHDFHDCPELRLLNRCVSGPGSATRLPTMRNRFQNPKNRENLRRPVSPPIFGFVRPLCHSRRSKMEHAN